MAGSNAEWGNLAEYDSAFAAAWDGFSTLPEAGHRPPLDALCERKNITIESLIRQGARLDGDTLVFGYPKGIKFRDLISDQRWSMFGSEFDTLKIVRHGAEPTKHVIVVEGETDGARLSDTYDADIAIMPAGARNFTEAYADQLRDYPIVLIGLDNDNAGKDGTEKATTYLANAMPFPPPATWNDWCEVPTGQMPDLPDELHRDTSALIVPAGALIELPEPNMVSWLEQAVLPVAGTMIVHGWAKSLKSFIVFDMLSALSQGQPWCNFEPTEEPCKVLVMQYEIPWAYYRQRVLQLRATANNVELFDTNYNTWEPQSRPKLVAGNKRQEDFVIQSCIDAGIQILLIDPIRRAMGGADFNSEQEVRPMLQFFERCNSEGITIVATHHDNKTSARSRGGDPADMTGSGAFAGDPDTLVSIQLPPGEDPRTSTRRNVHFTLRNSPPISPRAYQMTDSGLVYYTEPWGNAEDEDETAPEL